MPPSPPLPLLRSPLIRLMSFSRLVLASPCLFSPPSCLFYPFCFLFSFSSLVCLGWDYASSTCFFSFPLLSEGDPLKFNVTVTPTTDYPVDLYYLMDFSRSMEDDIDNLAVIARDLTEELEAISSQARVGFGSFIEKVPFAAFTLFFACVFVCFL